MTAQEHLEAEAELSCTRLGLSFVLASIAEPSAWQAYEMLVYELDRASDAPSTRTMRCLAFAAVDQLSDRMFGEHAHAAAAALACLDAHQS